MTFRNEEDDEEEDLDRQDRQDEEDDEDVYSDDMTASSSELLTRIERLNDTSATRATREWVAFA